MSEVIISEMFANIIANTFAALCNNGYIQIYDNEKQLSELRFTEPAFKPAKNGEVTANNILPDPEARAEGTASKYYILDSDKNKLLEGAIGLIGSGKPLEMQSLLIPLGATVQIESYVHKVPYGE